MSAPTREAIIQQRMRRTVGFSVALGVCAIAAFLFLKYATDAGTTDLHLERGFAELDLALDGQADHWESAERSFQRAAGQSVLDPYPIFCVATVARLASPTEPPATPTGTPPAPTLANVDTMLQNHQRAEARAALIELATHTADDVGPRAQLYLRFLTDLEVAHRRRVGP